MDRLKGYFWSSQWRCFFFFFFGKVDWEACEHVDVKLALIGFIRCMNIFYIFTRRFGFYWFRIIRSSIFAMGRVSRIRKDTDAINVRRSSVLIGFWSL